MDGSYGGNITWPQYMRLHYGPIRGKLIKECACKLNRVVAVPIDGMGNRKSDYDSTHHEDGRSSNKTIRLLTLRRHCVVNAWGGQGSSVNAQGGQGSSLNAWGGKGSLVIIIIIINNAW